MDSSGGFAGLRAGKCGSRPGTECRYAGGNDRYGGGRGRARPLSDNLTRIHRRCIGGGGGGGEVKRELVIRASRISLQIHNESRRLALPSTFFSSSPSLSVNWSVSSSLNSLSLSFSIHREEPSCVHFCYGHLKYSSVQLRYQQLCFLYSIAKRWVIAVNLRLRKFEKGLESWVGGTKRG